MNQSRAVVDAVHPWRVVAALLIGLMLFLGRADSAHALTVDSVSLVNSTVSAATDMSIDVSLDTNLDPGDTIVVTFPVGWGVPDSADLSGSVSWGGLVDGSPTITSDQTTRTITTTIGQPQFTGIPLTISIGAAAGLTNSGVAANYTVTVDATGNAQGTSGNIAIIAGVPVITGGNVTLASAAAGAQTAGTIAFALGNTVATGDSIILIFPVGWTVASGAMTAGNWTGLDAAPASVTGDGARTVTIVINAITAQTTPNVTLTIAASAELVNQTAVGGGLTINVGATGQTAADSNAFAITAGAPSAYTLTAPGAVAAGVASGNFTITITDAFGNTTNATQNTTFTLGSNTSGTPTFDPVSPVQVNAAASTVTFTYADTKVGAPTITATRASGDAVGGPQTANITITAGAPTQITLSGPASVEQNTASTSFTITVKDALGNTAVTTQNTTFTLTSSTGGTPTFTPASPVTVAIGTSSTTFTYRDTATGAKQVAATRASGDVVGAANANITVNEAPSADEGDGGAGTPRSWSTAARTRCRTARAAASAPTATRPPALAAYRPRRI